MMENETSRLRFDQKFDQKYREQLSFIICGALSSTFEVVWNQDLRMKNSALVPAENIDKSFVDA